MKEIDLITRNSK